MDDLRQRFAAFDRVPAPDVWGDVERRLETLRLTAPTRRLIDVHRESPRGSDARPASGDAPGRAGRRMIAVLVAVALVAALLGGAIAVGSRLVRLDSVSPPSPEPSATNNPSPSTSSARVTGPGSWTTAGRMVELRFGETATLLPDGKVLVAGGESSWGANGTTLATAELYDATTGQWTLTGSLHAARHGHGAVPLSNGEVLVMAGDASAGGLSATRASAELYNPTTGLWTPTGRMATARDGAAATLLGDGRVLVAGGFSANSGGAGRSAEIYDPMTGAWTATGAMNVSRQGHSATLLPDGRVLVAGGGCCDQEARASTELYDPVAGTWTRSGALASARVYLTAILLGDGKVLVFGGDNRSDHPPVTTAELFDPRTGTWAATGSPRDPGNSFESEGAVSGSAVRLLDGRILAPGYAGADELYDPASGAWSSVGRPDGDLYSYVHTSTLLADGRVLVTSEQFDGAGGGPTPVADLFDPEGTP